MKVPGAGREGRPAARPRCRWIRPASATWRGRSCGSARRPGRRGRPSPPARQQRVGELHARQPEPAGRADAARPGCGSTASSAASGVGLVNMLVYLVVAVFLAGLMVGRTPEYLGKKVEAREMKLAVAGPAGPPAADPRPDRAVRGRSDWGPAATNNPGPHGFSEILYEFTSASANNGSRVRGAGRHLRVQRRRPRTRRAPAPYAAALGHRHRAGDAARPVHPDHRPDRASPAAWRPRSGCRSPSGTLRTDTVTFGFVLLGTVLLVGALLFLPVAALGPVAEHLGPMPFGR